MSSVGSRWRSREASRVSLPAAASLARSRRERRPSAGRGRRRTRRGPRRRAARPVSTSMRWTPAGSARETLAAIRVTSAPRRAAAAARAMPMRPLERLPRKRTESIGSRVPPAVTRTRRPSQGRSPVGSSASTGPAAGRGPAAGPCRARRGRPGRPRRARSRSTPRSRRVARFAWVAASAYMRSFIAGATRRGAVQARKEVVTIESAMPAGQLRQRVGRSRGDQIGVAVGGELEVADRVVRREPGRRGRRRASGRARTRRSGRARRRCPRRRRRRRSGSPPRSSARARRARRSSPGAPIQAPCRRRSLRLRRAGFWPCCPPWSGRAGSALRSGTRT